MTWSGDIIIRLCCILLNNLPSTEYQFWLCSCYCIITMYLFTFKKYFYKQEIIYRYNLSFNVIKLKIFSCLLGNCTFFSMKIFVFFTYNNWFSFFLVFTNIYVAEHSVYEAQGKALLLTQEYLIPFNQS